MTLLSLDSSAVLTWILQQRGWQAIDRIMGRSDVDLVLVGPVLTEVIHLARRKGNISPSQQIRSTLVAQGLRVVHPVDDDLVRAAELLELSDRHPGRPIAGGQTAATLSLADALILAISERLQAPVLTGDTYWGWLVDQGLVDLKMHLLHHP